MSQAQGAAALVVPIIRRDRVRLGVWFAAVVLLVVITVASTKGLYPTQASLDAAARLAIDNPAAVAFNGPAVALDTMGGQIVFQLGAFGPTMVGLMSVLLTARFTRAEEESGRLELLRASPIGRHAPLAAGVAVVAALDVAVGAATAGVLLASDLPVAGSLAEGTVLAVAGLFFTGLAALTAQLSDNTRVCSGIAGAVLGASFAIRAVGDAYAPGLSWVSPVGLVQKARPYGDERWWPLLLAAGLGAALLTLGVALANRRDFGSGLFPARPGPPRAAPSLRTPLGLAVRLSRASVVWWTVGIMGLAAVYGSLASAIEDFVSDNDTLTDYLARASGVSLTDSFLSTALLLNALLPAGAAVQVLGRVRSDELDGRAEVLLATPTSRWSWFGGYLAVALVGSSLALLAGGLALAVSAAAVLQDAGELGRLTVASLAYLPAVWVIVAATTAILGAFPRAAIAAWGLWAFCLVVSFFGTLIDLPTLVFDLSPFQHVPLVPAEPFESGPFVALLGLSAVLLVAGGVGLRRRDIGT